MKSNCILVGLLLAGLVVEAKAADTFPVFSKTSITVSIPTNTPGYKSDPAFEVGGNAIYTLNGQIFTNAADGQLQTIAGGFSGTNTDKSTPWKTLTQLLAAYQQGVASNKVGQLYTSGSQAFLDSIYTNSSTTSDFQAFASSISGMQVLMGFDCTNGFAAIVSISFNDSSPNESMPFFFMQNSGAYLLSSFENTLTNVSNIASFLNGNSVTNLLH